MVKIDNLVKRIREISNKDLEQIVLMEECGEVIQAVAHTIRPDRKPDVAHLTEELAQLYVSMAVVRGYFDISDEDIQKEVDKKYRKHGLTHEDE